MKAETTISSIACWNKVSIMSEDKNHQYDNATVSKQPTYCHVVMQSDLNDNDVLSGRGGWVQQYPGNVQFRKLLRKHKQRYNESNERGEKSRVIRSIVDCIQSMDPPGRFLKEQTFSSSSTDILLLGERRMEECAFVELDYKDAAFKTRKAIRSISGKDSTIKKIPSRSSTPLSTSSATESSMAPISDSRGNQNNFHHDSFTSVEAFIQTADSPLQPTMAVPQPPPPPTSSSALSHSTKNSYKINISTTSNGRREQYKVFKNEQSFYDDSKFSRNRTYSNERSQLLKESQILSSSNIVANISQKPKEQQGQQQESAAAPPPLPLMTTNHFFSQSIASIDFRKNPHFLPMAISSISLSTSNNKTGEEDTNNEQRQKSQDKDGKYTSTAQL